MLHQNCGIYVPHKHDSNFPYVVGILYPSFGVWDPKGHWPSIYMLFTPEWNNLYKLQVIRELQSSPLITYISREDFVYCCFARPTKHYSAPSNFLTTIRDAIAELFTRRPNSRISECIFCSVWVVRLVIATNAILLLNFLAQLVMHMPIT